MTLQVETMVEAPFLCRFLDQQTEAMELQLIACHLFLLFF